MRANKLSRKNKSICDFDINWLIQQTTLDAIEKYYGQRREGERSEQWKQKWGAFRDKVQEGDEIWEYTSPPKCWQIGFGSSGYAIVRAGELVDRLQTRMN